MLANSEILLKKGERKMNNPYVDILCPHCGEFVTPIYDNECPNCGESLRRIREEFD